MQFFEELELRGLVQNLSDPQLFDKLPKGSKFYVGFDPTSPSLQIGNLAILFTALRFARAGYRPVILFGGATGAIGDPRLSGERQLLSRETIDQNVAAQIQQVRAIFGNFSVDLEFVNNWDWTHSLSTLDFLRDVGKFFTVNYMLAKDTVKTRLADEGISYTEFSYMLLQAYDYSHLFDSHSCRLQIGASDQWGNITAGLELIRKKQQGEAYGFTMPLITDSSGKKYGKSEGNAVWLDPAMTSVYKFHQFFLNTPDSDVIRLLKVYAFIELDEIIRLEQALMDKPEERLPQNVLADHICELVHGKTALSQAKKSAEVLFSEGDLSSLDESTLLDIFAHVPSSNIEAHKLSTMNVIDIFVHSKLANSKGEARRLVQNGGAYINNQRVVTVDQSLADLHNSARKLMLLRSGKKSYHLIKLVS